MLTKYSGRLEISKYSFARNIYEIKVLSLFVNLVDIIRHFFVIVSHIGNCLVCKNNIEEVFFIENI